MSEINQETAIVTQETAERGVTMWNNDKALQRSWKAAQMLGKTALVPDLYRGQPENCLIALDVANRVNWSPLMVMQNLTVVKGKPAWNGQASIAIVNGSGRFSPINFVFDGEGNDFGCVARARRLADGEICESERVTIQMAVDEGWIRNPKWKTMTKLMMQYRSGSFFARAYCPDLMLGISTVEELADIGKGEVVEAEKVKVVFDA